MDYIRKMRSVIGHDLLLLAGTSVLLFNNENELLLVYRADTNDWGVPGGYIEIGETFEQAATREVAEETGLTIKDLTFFQVFSGPEFYFTYPNGDKVYNVVSCYIVRDYEGEFASDNEILGHQFFSLDQLPEKIMSHSRVVIDAYMKHGDGSTASL